MQRDLLLCWHECTWPPTQKLSWQLAWWHYICSLICQQMEKEDCNFPALERNRRSESNIQQNVRPWRPSMPSTKCLRKREWTITALQPCKETCCCVGMNAHDLQLKSLAGSLPGYTTLIVDFLPSDRQKDYSFLALEWKCRSESNIQQNVRPWRPSMPSTKCLKKMEWTIMALQPCKETCCCVGMNAHGLQLKSLAGSLPGDTTLIVVYLPADRKRRLQLPCTWTQTSECEQLSTKCDTLKTLHAFRQVCKHYVSESSMQPKLQDEFRRSWCIKILVDEGSSFRYKLMTRNESILNNSELNVTKILQLNGTKSYAFPIDV